jgi:hypothetical protein
MVQLVRGSPRRYAAACSQPRRPSARPVLRRAAACSRLPAPPPSSDLQRRVAEQNNPAAREAPGVVEPQAGAGTTEAAP